MHALFNLEFFAEDTCQLFYYYYILASYSRSLRDQGLVDSALDDLDFEQDLGSNSGYQARGGGGGGQQRPRPAKKGSYLDVSSPKLVPTKKSPLGTNLITGNGLLS